MTADELARSYFWRAAKRMLALRVLFDAELVPTLLARPRKSWNLH
jgi:hypothetical protein